MPRAKSCPVRLVLPAFEILRRQPKPPNVARKLVEKAIPNEHGTPITYSVRVNRRGTEWWVSASLHGHRMSNTLHTGTRAKAEAWIKAIESSCASVAPDDPL